jgi:hypothetical protein
MEQMEISNNSKPNGNERTYEGEAINKFAQMSQSDKKRGL